MNPQLFTNVNIFDGTGAQCFPGEVLVAENLITAVSKDSSSLERSSDMDIIDSPFCTLEIKEDTGEKIGRLKELMKEYGDYP